MPLTNCPDCNQQVSDQAPTCPSCGRPIKEHPAPPPLKSKEGLFLKTMNIGCAIFFILIILGIIATTKTCTGITNKLNKTSSLSLQFPCKMEVINQDADCMFNPGRHTRLTYFDKGKIVTAIEKDGDWYLIKRIYSDTTCWVHQNDLKPVR